MTEAEWLNSNHHPQAMHWHLRQSTNVVRTKSGKRKLRLFACGGCRLIWNLLSNPLHQDAIQVAELFADSLATKQELEAARNSVQGLSAGTCLPEEPGYHELTARTLAEKTTASRAVEAAFYMTAMPVPLAGLVLHDRDGDGILSDLFRDIFGNPFRPAPTLDPAWLRWRDATIPRLAQQMYDSRDFASMPILADALEEAGCTSGDILEHCRGPGPHVRGCWVVDLLLGKE